MRHNSIKSQNPSALNWWTGHNYGPRLGSVNMTASLPLVLGPTWLPSQIGDFTSSMIRRRDSESVLWGITITWLPGPVSAHPFLLILRIEVAACCIKQKQPFWVTSEWFRLNLNAVPASLFLQPGFLSCSQQEITNARTGCAHQFLNIYRELFQLFS